MASAQEESKSSPTIARFVIVGMLVGVLGGAVVGVVLGVIAYPPTAWAAAIEVGLPAAFAGAVIGLVCWAVLAIRHRRAVPRDSGR